MFASFHSKGTIPSCSDMLNTCASGLLICSTVSFSILGYNPSTPGDLFSFILLILLATTSGVTINCPNLSSSDPLNFVSGTGNHRRSQDFCLCGGGGTRPTPPSLASVVHTFEAVVGSRGSVSAPAVSRVMGGTPERNKNSKTIYSKPRLSRIQVD